MGDTGQASTTPQPTTTPPVGSYLTPIGFLLALASIVAFLTLGFGKAIETRSSYSVGDLDFTSSDKEFNWILAFVGAGPLLVAGAVFWGFGLVLDELRKRR